MNFIWDAMHQPASPSRPFDFGDIVDNGLKQGWFDSRDIAFLLRVSDPRLNLEDMGMNVIRFVEAFGFHWSEVTSRPRPDQDNCYFDEVLRPAEFTSFLLDLERLGFTVDPSPLIDALAPGLCEQEKLTGPELDVFWTPRTRGRATKSLRVDGYHSSGETREGEVAGGYRYQANFSREGDLVSMTVYGPDYRAADNRR